MYSWFILGPLAAVIILNLPLREALKRAAFWCVSLLLSIQIIAVLFLFANSFKPLPDLNPLLKFNLNLDGISAVVLLSIAIVFLVTLFVARAIVRDRDKMFNFSNLLLIALMGANGIALAADIFSLYVFIEVTAATTYILIAFDKDKYALESAFKYIILSAVASAMMLSAIALLILLCGDTNFSAISLALKSLPHSYLTGFAIGLFLCGLFIKGGLMPFHGWLPDVYSASPAYVSVLLSGIITKVLGIYALIRIVVSVTGFMVSVSHLLLFIGSFSIVLGALAALTQSDFKRMLAYSSISQVGYIIIGLGCATPLGILGAVFHLFNHAIFKSTLFVNSAAVESQTKTRNMDDLRGLAQKMPATGITSLISCLSAAGIPPLAGFWSKLIIVVALWVAGYRLYAAIAILASVITLAYFLSLQRRVFFGNIKEEFSDIKEARLGLVLPALILAAITVGVGLVFPWLSNFFRF